jgi:hypothetical protein
MGLISDKTETTYIMQEYGSMGEVYFRNEASYPTQLALKEMLTELQGNSSNVMSGIHFLSNEEFIFKGDKNGDSTVAEIEL